MECHNISIIVAMTRDRVIGSKGSLPWQLPDEMQLFKRLTMGSTVIMGRNTYASIGGPLPGRENIVVSRSLHELPGGRLCKDFREAMTVAGRIGRPVFVIGGGQLYREALPTASTLHVSWIKSKYSGDVYFPELLDDEWVVSETVEYPDFCYNKYLRTNRGKQQDPA